MSYVTAEQLVEEWGETKAIQLTTSTSKGEIDYDKIALAVRSAEDEINAYCSKRYVTPFNPAPYMVIQYVKRLTIINLRREKGQHGDSEKSEYENIMRELREIAKGGKNIPDVETIKQPLKKNELPKFNTSARHFSRDKLRDF